jgi:branched-chain amino acid transport system permease protein
MGSVLGPVVGAISLLVFEEVLPSVITAVASVVSEVLPVQVTEVMYRQFGPVTRAGEYWQIVMGPLLLLVVLFARGGIDGVLASLSDLRARPGRG